MTALLCVKEQHVPRRTCTQKGRPWRSCKQWGQLWGQQVPCASSDGGRPRPHRDTAGRWVTRGRGSRPAATGQSSCLEHDRYRCVTSGTCLYSWFKSHFTHQFRFKVTLKVKFLGSVFFFFLFYTFHDDAGVCFKALQQMTGFSSLLCSRSVHMTQSMSQFRNVNQITKIVEKTQLGLLGNSLGVTVDSDLTYTRSRLVQTREEDAFSNTVHPDVALCCQPMSSHRAFIVAQPPHTEQSLSLLQICSWHQDTFNTETKIWSHEIMKAVENSVSQRVGCENNCG